MKILWKDFEKIKEDLKRLKNHQFIRDDLVLSYLFLMASLSLLNRLIASKLLKTAILPQKLQKGLKVDIFFKKLPFSGI